MRRLLMPLAAMVLGCQTYSVHVPLRVERQVAAMTSARALPTRNPKSEAPNPKETVSDFGFRISDLVSLDLPVLWNLALVNNPSLREAAAEVEAALGKRIQAA